MYEKIVSAGSCLIPGYMNNGEMYYFQQWVALNNTGWGGGPIPVFENLETRLKVGFLVITKKKEEDLNDNWFVEHLMGTNETGTYSWELKNAQNHVIATGQKKKIYALPPGEYTLRKRAPYGSSEDDVTYRVTIVPGKWVTNGIKQNN